MLQECGDLLLACDLLCDKTVALHHLSNVESHSGAGAVVIAAPATSPSNTPAATALATSPIALAPGADIFTAGGPLAGGAGEDDTPRQTMKTSWIIVIAVAVTALTIAIMVFGLWMCGFIRPSIDHTVRSTLPWTT